MPTKIFCKYDGCKNLRKMKRNVRYCKKHYVKPLFNMKSVENFLQDNILEKYIVYDIMNIKKQLENADLAKKYLKIHGNWFYISRDQSLSEDFMHQFQDDLCWKTVTRNHELSESFIRGHPDKVDWECISHDYRLPEYLIRDFPYKICWFHIDAQNRKFSDDFIHEFQGRFNFTHMTLIHA